MILVLSIGNFTDWNSRISNGQEEFFNWQEEFSFFLLILIDEGDLILDNGELTRMDNLALSIRNFYLERWSYDWSCLNKTWV